LRARIAGGVKSGAEGIWPGSTTLKGKLGDQILQTPGKIFSEIFEKFWHCDLMFRKILKHFGEFFS